MTMKYLIIVGDGMGDLPIESLGGRTPLQAANIPHINTLSRQGLLGLARTTPEGAVSGSDMAHLSLLGYDHRQWPISRAPLEAVSLGISLAPGDVAYRCNLVTFLRGSATGAGGGYDFEVLGPKIIMEDYSAGHIPSDQARDLIHDLDDQIGTEEIQFYPGLNYRHLMIWIGGKTRVQCRAPQEIVGQKVIENLPKGEGESVLSEIIKGATEVLSLHPINEGRRQEGLKPANGIWLWGQGKSVSLPSFSKVYGLSGAVVAAVDLVRGLGASLGLEVVDVPEATGYLDTNYAGKAQAALKALESKDFVLLHVEAPDEASHEGNLEAKIKAIEDIDREVVGAVSKEIEGFDAFRLLFLCDHRTPVMLRRHTADPVPYFIFEKSKAPRIQASGQDYHEASAEASGHFFENGVELMNYFLKG